MAGYFAIFLVLLTLACTVTWLLERFLLAPKRQQKLAFANAQSKSVLPEQVQQDFLKQPAIVETAISILPVVAGITLLRSFLYEPFQIPSGSMMPTLLVGDFILVEKFSYDVKDPVWRKTLWSNNQPERGDVAVFKYPPNPRLDYIKRVVGLPGDRIVYKQKQLYIQRACSEGQTSGCGNLEMIPLTFQAEAEFFMGPLPQRRYEETLGQVTHNILQTPMLPDNLQDFYRQPGTGIDEFVVPAGHYFVLGDNRDNSVDSRFWGFVPADNMVGKAVFVWMSFEFSEDPNSWLPRWVPVGVRFARLGPIH
ncbi:signal peptidase I [Alishewanella sp. 16-MA]|uniref:Signal peptidase I n=1 Tax=Alishewanella maricola TaxID=2795740 RepID=A0ABS8BZM4_9ALTE|nr:MULTISPECIES: signal peptidase I [Alishewanella]MDP4945853.1 signal peptidase I [Alishewanella sp.]MCB5225516.1 signal peptidase I [Alishewanella maricola]MDP5035094.1 signal peptidase I [Alishewanella sp.]MDP5188016.1 signal peptidase I [Alishewanella sp.]MDP5458594.1 signal peptidase I [Alishewanella sp. SMS8]